ncbi:MAG TPA: hypothetical protein VE569_12535 [Acidimicrobiia bacterium]|jgi:hypothetical protein|nr:hypothetical protein [Acidimicrobiia bacterium]
MRDEGHAAVELAMAVGVLLFPVAIVVLAFAPWSERRVEAEAVAAEATRIAVLELSQAAGDTQIVTDTDSLGIDPSEVRVGWCGASPTSLRSPSGSCPMDRGAVISVTIELWTPLVTTPWGEVGGLWVTADHSEPIDLYRSMPGGFSNSEASGPSNSGVEGG